MNARNEWLPEWPGESRPEPQASTVAQVLLWLLRPVLAGVAIVLGIVLVVNGVL